jgi:hypothetical protein
MIKMSNVDESYEIKIDGKEYTIQVPDIQHVPENDRVHLNMKLLEDGSIDIDECKDKDAGRRLYEKIYGLFMEEVKAIPDEHFTGHQLQIGVEEDKIESHDEFVNSLIKDNNENYDLREELIQEFQTLLDTYPLMFMISNEPNFDTTMRYTCKNLISFATSVNMQLAKQGLDFNNDEIVIDNANEIEDMPRLFQFLVIILQSLYITMNPNGQNQ